MMKQALTLLVLLCIYIVCGAQATTLKVDNNVPGTLSQRILYDDKLTVENLIITGELNGDDLKFIQTLNSSYNLTGTLDISEVLLTGSYSYGNGTFSVLTNNINVKAFQTSRRLNKLILPKSATQWTESACFSSSARITHLNVDSLILSDPKFKAIGGIGNPSYLYIGEGVETFYMNNSEDGSKYTGVVDFYLPSSLKSIYITSSKVGTPDTITVHANMLSVPSGFGNSNGNTPTKEELSFFANGKIYVPEGTKKAYESSMFKNLEIIAPVSVSEISLNKSEARIIAGESLKLEADIIPSNADNQDIIWCSSDDKIATVDENGLIFAKKGGYAQIVAYSAETPNIKAVCHITVIQPVYGITLNTNNIVFTEDEFCQLIATVLPDDASDKTIKWTSSDISVAMVSQDGTIYAIKPGQATIMATTVDGDFVALCKVTVKAKVISATAIRLSHANETIAIGETLQLNAVLEPENVTNKNISWTSTNPNIATVNSNGRVQAIAEGSTKIIATTTDGSNLSAICEISVKKQFVEITQIQISPSHTRIPVGKSVKLDVILTPNDATSTNVVWSSTNTSVAKVSQDGNVEAIAEGEAIIIASTQDGSNLSATCNISVYNQIIHISEIILNPDNIEGYDNESSTINVVIIPENATNKQLRWYSSNDNVATVKDGVVKLIKKGTAIITAEALDGSNVKSECAIVVFESAGIEDIIENKNTYVKIFNLSGHPIYQGIYADAKIESGIYIVLCDGKSFKVKIE
ncbi:MAG: Ig-like domain-containing protein [Muribaculaceae bacterium]|nr:Ig-like domain-containing protein [Muribaculaceae bacterium]